MTSFEDCFALALEIVLDEDVPDASLAEAVTAHAALIAGFTPDTTPCYLAD